MRQHHVSHDGPVTIAAVRPTADQYLHLREHAGFAAVSPRAAESALAGSLYSVCALHDNQVVGCGRVVGDGGLCFHVQDVIVEAAYRGQGVGGRIMEALLEWLRSNAGDGASVGLSTSQDASGFFRHYGFEPSPEGCTDMYLPGAGRQPGKLSSPTI